MRLILYREQRLQPLWMLLLALTMTTSLGIAWGTAAGPWLGWPTGAALSLLAAVWWWQRRSPIEVSAEGIRVGEMFLERMAVGDVVPLSPADFAVRTSTGSKANDANSLLRRSQGGVVLSVNDATDPLTHWVIGSAHSQELAQAVQSMQSA